MVWNLVFDISSMERLLIDPEDGADMFLRNVSWLSTNYTSSYLKKMLFMQNACNISWDVSQFTY
jgi:hypothetical protein